MYANVCDSPKHASHGLPSQSVPRCHQAVFREGPGCLGEGRGWSCWGGAVLLLTWAGILLAFLLGVLQVGRRGLGPSLLLCLIVLPPGFPPRSRLLPLPSQLYFWSISLEMHAPSLPSSRCLLAWSSQSCVQVRAGGRFGS